MLTGGGIAALAGLVGAVSTSDGVAAASGEFEPLDRLELPGAKELVVDGEVAYVATTDGFATVDVSDPSDLQVLAERRGLMEDHPDGPLEDVWDGKVGGDHYAIGGPANPTDREVPDAAMVFDVSDPADPEEVLTHETDFYHHNLDVADGTLYLCGNDGERNPLVCVDVASGEEVGRWSIVDADQRWADVYPHLFMLHDVWVEDDVAYCSYWNGGTWLVDVSDPTEPEPLVGFRVLDPDEQAEIGGAIERREARYRLPGNDHFAMPQRGVEGSDRVAINEEAWTGEADAPASELGAVEIWETDLDRDGTDDGGAGGDDTGTGADDGDPDGGGRHVGDTYLGDAQRLARIEVPPTSDATADGVWTTSHNFDFVGDRLYTSWYRGGVKVHDVSDPAAPVEYAHWRDEATTSFWTAQRGPDSVLASSWRDPSRDDPLQGAAVYAFPDPADPVESGSEGFGAGMGPLAGLIGVGAGLGLAALARWLRDCEDDRST